MQVNTVKERIPTDRLYFMGQGLLGHVRKGVVEPRSEQYISHKTAISAIVSMYRLFDIIKGSLDEKLPSYEVLKMLKE